MKTAMTKPVPCEWTWQIKPIPSYLTSTSPVPLAGVKERGVIKRTEDTAVLSQPFKRHNWHSGLTRWTGESCSTLSQIQEGEPDYLIFCSKSTELMREEKDHPYVSPQSFIINF